jgi:putative transposase
VQRNGIDVRKTFVDPTHPEFDIKHQCDLLELSRSTYYYHPLPIKEADLKVMNRIDMLFLKFPCYGARRMSQQLKREGIQIGRLHTGTLMKVMGIAPVYLKRLTSKPHPGHKIYPYLLRGVPITHKNHVWSADITYIRLKHGFVYLVAVMDWFSRQVLSWRLSTTLESAFCCAALQEAMANYGQPDIFNTDQGAQFTGDDFTGILKDAGIQISMDGRGRALDNVYIERLWWSLKYEEVYLTEYASVSECRERIGAYFKLYNEERIHRSLGYHTPAEAYFGISREFTEAV